MNSHVFSALWCSIYFYLWCGDDLSIFKFDVGGQNRKFDGKKSQKIYVYSYGAVTIDFFINTQKPTWIIRKKNYNFYISHSSYLHKSNGYDD